MAVVCATLHNAGVNAHIIYISQKQRKTWTAFHFYWILDLTL
jgi:hypothetical protein